MMKVLGIILTSLVLMASAQAADLKEHWKERDGTKIIHLVKQGYELKSVIGGGGSKALYFQKGSSLFVCYEGALSMQVGSCAELVEEFPYISKY